jgi:3-dehydroquinate synthase
MLPGFRALKPDRLRRDPSLLNHLVATSAALKCAVVDEDPDERTGRRNILNAGHTVGHALEWLSSYRMSHGEAVAAGLLWESATAVAQGHLAKAELAPVEEALAGLAFPGSWRDFSPESVFEAAGADKKNRAGAVAYVPLGSVGRPALPPPHVAELTLASLRAGLCLLGKT